MTFKTSTLRLQIILLMGARCSVCGWAADPRVLKILRQDGKNVPSGGGAQWLQHLLYVQGHSEEFLLICANCWGVRRLRRQTIVWNIEGLPLEIATPQAIEKLQEQGADVWIVHHGRVFGDCLDDLGGVEEFKSRLGISEIPSGVSIHG